jgi:hypothetical protein
VVAESPHAKQQHLRDTLDDDVKGTSTVIEEQVDNPGRGHADGETVIGAEAGVRAPTRQGTRQRTSKPSKKVEGTPKRMRMTEVERLKTDLQEPKGQKALRWNKERVDKVADPTSKGGNESEQHVNKMKSRSAKRTTTTDKSPHEIEEFKKGDIVRLMGFEEGEDDTAVARAKVVNVAGRTLHGKTIFPGLVSVEVSESLVENYKLFASVDLDDPPVTLVGKAVGHYVLWPTEFMEIDTTL